MIARILASITWLVILLAPAAAQTKPAAAKWTQPTTPDGQPDLQGVWINSWATPLERPKELTGREFLTEQEVAEFRKRAKRLFTDQDGDFAAGDGLFQAVLANREKFVNPAAIGGAQQMLRRDFDNRTSMIVDPPDGRIPPLTPAGQQRIDTWTTALLGLRPPAGPEDLVNHHRCITFGVPIIGFQAGSSEFSYQRIIQSRGYVVILMEAIHDARIIPLDGRPHLPPRVRTWNGDSRGRWEGQSLVVDTTNFSSNSYFLGSADNLHLVERFTRVAPNEIEYVVTSEDSTTWTKPWTAKVRLMQTQYKIYELACHEGNRTVMEDMLAGARAQEKAVEENAKKSPK